MFHPYLSFCGAHVESKCFLFLSLLRLFSSMRAAAWIGLSSPEAAVISEPRPPQLQFEPRRPSLQLPVGG